MFKRILSLVGFLFFLAFVFEAKAEEPTDLRVGVWEIGPFAFKKETGEWTGISIELWEHVANQLGLSFEYVPYNHHDLLKAIEEGTVDVGIADIPADFNFEDVFEYSRTYFHSELAIASRENIGSTLTTILKVLGSPAVLTVIALMGGLVVVAAILFIPFEKKVNEEVYSDDHKGFNFINSILWASLLITAQEPDLFKNKTIAGRLIAVVLLVVGVTASASFIAIITSSFTVNQITTKVHGAEDLPFIRVGALSDSRAEEYLGEHHLKHAKFDELVEGMKELEDGRIDAFVADEVELRFYIRKHSESPISVLPVELETEYYALAFPETSSLPALVNPVILEFIERPLWKELIKRHVGVQNE